MLVSSTIRTRNGITYSTTIQTLHERTDEQLQELMKSAFANVKASMDCLRLEIAQARAIAFERVSKMFAES